MVAGCCGACGVQVLDDRKVEPMEINFAPETSLPMPEEKTLPSDTNMMLDPEALLRTINGRQRDADMVLARKIASQMRDPAYSLRMYHDDLVKAFPELQYCESPARCDTLLVPLAPRPVS